MRVSQSMSPTVPEISRPVSVELFMRHAKPTWLSVKRLRKLVQIAIGHMMRVIGCVALAAP